MLLRNCATASTYLESKTINLRARMFIINRERFNLETVKTKYSEIETEFEYFFLTVITDVKV